MDFTRGISNRYINKILYVACPTTYKGCWSSDNVPFSVLSRFNNYSLVINLSKRSERGTHFITILVTEKKFWLIDSLSLFNIPQHLNQQLRKYLHPGRKCIRLPKHEWQSVESVFCGFYCIYSCIFFQKQTTRDKTNNLKMINISKPFSKTNLNQNDDVLVIAVRKIYLNKK